MSGFGDRSQQSGDQNVARQSVGQGQGPGWDLHQHHRARDQEIAAREYARWQGARQGVQRNTLFTVGAEHSRQFQQGQTEVPSGRQQIRREIPDELIDPRLRALSDSEKQEKFQEEFLKWMMKKRDHLKTQMGRQWEEMSEVQRVARVAEQMDADSYIDQREYSKEQLSQFRQRLWKMAEIAERRQPEESHLPSWHHIEQTSWLASCEQFRQQSILEQRGPEQVAEELSQRMDAERLEFLEQSVRNIISYMDQKKRDNGNRG